MESPELLGWCLVGNIIPEGTKHFTPGTKVYLNYPLSNEFIVVLGRHRGAIRLVMMHINRSKVTDWRVRAIYNKGISDRIRLGSKEDAEAQLERMTCGT